MNQKSAGPKTSHKTSNQITGIFEKNQPFLLNFLRKLILKALNETFPEAKLHQNAVNIEHPKNNNYGDYSTNIAMILSGQLKIKPSDAAEKLSRKIEEYIRSGQMISNTGDKTNGQKINFKVSDILENVNFVLPGFVNLFLAKKWLISQTMRLPEVKETVESDQNANSEANFLKNYKVMVEFTDPNPFKDFHIGHLYSNSVGESLSRIFEYFGADLKKVNYQGDVGMHVAKAIWGIRKQILEKGIQFSGIEKKPLKERIDFLGKSYAQGATAYEENESAKEEMKNINYYVFISAQEYLKETKNFKPLVEYRKYIEVDSKELEDIGSIYKKGREWSMEYFETIYRQLGTKFDYYYTESIVGEYGYGLVNKSIAKGLFVLSEGAVVFPGEKYGLHTRVFINKLGFPTYEAKELGLAPTKYRDFPYDFSLIVTGKEIDEYFNVLLKALSLIDKNLAEKTTHLGHGMVRLPQGKMSSRTGEIVTGESLILTVKNMVKKKLDSGFEKYSPHEYEDISQKAAVSAIKYSFLKVGLPADLIFDLEKSVSFEGDSGPYLMYTYARCRSVQRKSELQNPNFKSNPNYKIQISKFTLNSEEMELLRVFYRFEEVVWEAAKSLAPNLICTYLYDLAQKYNLFYQKHSILQNPKSKIQISNDESNFRLVLTEATATILKQGLYLLGIETVEKM